MKIHLQGYIKSSPYNEKLFLTKNVDSRYGQSLADEIDEKLSDCDYGISKHQGNEDDDFSAGVDISIYIPNVSLRMYFSNTEKPLEEVQENIILQTLGALDVYQEWYGYSEYTIEGFDLINLSIGNHDLENILRSYLNKYVHIIMEFD